MSGLAWATAFIQIATHSYGPVGGPHQISFPMAESAPFIDIHSHILPAIDDGAADAREALAMARMAVEDGAGTIIATPHQRGSFARNHGAEIRTRVTAFQQLLEQEHVALRILPGGETRIEPGDAEAEIVAGVQSGELLTLGNQGRYFLMDLPEQVYVPLDRLVAEVKSLGIIPILAHPERNREIVSRPEVLLPLVEAGCLLQVTAGSVLGEFGPVAQEIAERLILQGLVHLIASDGHHVHYRPPLLAAAIRRVGQLNGGVATASLFEGNAAAIIAGQPAESLPPLVVPA